MRHIKATPGKVFNNINLMLFEDDNEVDRIIIPIEYELRMEILKWLNNVEGE